MLGLLRRLTRHLCHVIFFVSFRAYIVYSDSFIDTFIDCVLVKQAIDFKIHLCAIELEETTPEHVISRG